MERQSIMAEEVVRLVKPNGLAENQQSSRMTSSNQLKVEQTDIPPCLRTAWRRSQKERKPLLDGGKGKKVVSFHGSVVFEHAKEGRECQRRHFRLSACEGASNFIRTEHCHPCTCTCRRLRKPTNKNQKGDPQLPPTSLPVSRQSKGLPHHKLATKPTSNPTMYLDWCNHAHSRIKQQKLLTPLSQPSQRRRERPPRVHQLLLGHP